MPLAPPVTTATGVNESDWAGALVLVEVKSDSRLKIVGCDWLRFFAVAFKYQGEC